MAASTRLHTNLNILSIFRQMERVQRMVSSFILFVQSLSECKLIRSQTSLLDHAVKTLYWLGCSCNDNIEHLQTTTASFKQTPIVDLPDHFFKPKRSVNRSRGNYILISSLSHNKYKNTLRSFHTRVTMATCLKKKNHIW